MIEEKKKDNRLLFRYAGFATQLIVALGLTVFIGMKIDQWLKFKNPLAVWVLPLLVIIGLIVKVIKDTAPKKPGNEKR